MLLIQTNANQERVAEEALTASHRACHVYFPKILIRRSHARRVDYVVRPFLPRYGFIERYSDWRVVRTAPGVLCIVTSGEEVRRAAHEIRAREVDGYVQLGEELQQANGFRPGDVVVVTTLAAAGLFRRMKDAARAVVLLEMFGNKREVNVPLSTLVAA